MSRSFRRLSHSGLVKMMAEAFDEHLSGGVIDSIHVVMTFDTLCKVRPVLRRVTVQLASRR